MEISTKARLVSLIIALAFMAATLIGGSTLLIVKYIKNSNAIISGNYTPIGNIFNSDGSSLNASVCTILLNILGDDTGAQSNLYGGAPIVFQMGDKEWQVVYRDTSDSSDIITVWMTEPYIDSIFETEWMASTSNQYTSSDIYTTLNNYYDTQLLSYSALSQIVVTPNDVSSSYQTAQTQQYSEPETGIGSILGTLNGTEHFWLPSLYEAFSFWGLDENDRSFDDTDASGYCWLRSASSYHSFYALQVSSLGAAHGAYVNSSGSIRPAAHLSLSAIEEAILPSYSITVNASPINSGTAFGSGTYKQGTQIELEATANSGYEFVGWDTNGNNQYDSGEPTANPYTFTVTGNATITAIFEPIYNITIRTNNAEYGQIFVKGTLQNEAINVLYEDLQISNIMAIPTVNCAFLYWYDESNGSVYYDNPLNYTVSQTATLTAYFGSGLVDGVAVSVEGIEGVDLSAIGEARIMGYTTLDGIDYVHFSAVACTGYRFVGWRVDGEILSGYTESADIPYTLVENKQVFAVFEPINTNMNGETDNNQTTDIV